MESTWYIESLSPKELTMEVTAEEKVRYYRTMYTIRSFEEQTIVLSRKGLMGGGLHLSIGQEACAVGATSALKAGDMVGSTHRGHGIAIAKGVEPRRIFAEFLGREPGTNRGRGGSMHLNDLDIGLLGGNGIVGGNIPICTGIALAFKHRGDEHVVLCIFGDGTINTGAFHEAVNLAAIWKLPILFACENNQYAITMPIKMACALHNVADRASGYGIPSTCVDGNDVSAVREATLVAAERARTGKGPTLLEFQTYRWLGHSMTDNGSDRPPEEVRYWKEKRDPINLWKQRLLAEKCLNEEKLEEIHREVAQEIQAAVEFAMNSEPARSSNLVEENYYTIT